MQINITEILNTTQNFLIYAKDVISENINNWMPTLMSILSFIIFVIIGLARIKKAANDLKSDKTIAELKAEVENDIAESKQLRKMDRKIINRLMKIYDAGIDDEDREDREDGTKRKQDR